MSEREEKLEQVAEAIADDLPIEWAEAKDPWLDTRMRNLRQLERIRIVYRNIETSTGAPRPLADRTARGGPRARSEGPVTGGAEPAGGSTGSGEPDGTGPRALWGELELVERVGAGSGGEVYRAWDPALRTDVALKLLPETLPEGAGTPAQFLEEARQLAKVRHPNVVTVHGAARHGGRVGLWMDYVQGRTLEQDLRERGPWSAEEAAVVGLDLVRALAAVHAGGLVHRDVKTSNIMRERGGRVLLMDFGTVVEQPRLAELSAGDSFVGTARYMAPEIFRGERGGRASDIYSLGVVLYRLVTGGYPVDAPDAVQLRDKHVRGESTPLREARADLPRAFVRIVERALAADPAHRYPNVAEIENDLAAYLGRQPQEDEDSARRPALLRGLALAAVVAVAAWFGVRSLVPPAFEVDAELFRIREGAEERLRAGSQVAPGDRLFLEISSPRALYAYVFNEDDAGNSYLLFPLEDLPLANPLPPDATHRLPGSREGGAQLTWDVTSAGGRERIYVVAATTALTDLEAEITRLPRAGAGVPARPLTREAVRVLHRGLGGVSEMPTEEAGGGDAPLSDVFGRVADRADGKDGVWAWSITLENPAP